MPKRKWTIPEGREPVRTRRGGFLMTKSGPVTTKPVWRRKLDAEVKADSREFDSRVEEMKRLALEAQGKIDKANKSMERQKKRRDPKNQL